MTIMRNIQLADKLITKTFGVNGSQVILKKFQIDKTKLLFVLDYGNFTVQFDIRENKIIHKFDGEQVKFETQNILYDQAQNIRHELFGDLDEDDQMTIDEVENDIIDAEYKVVDDEKSTKESSDTKTLDEPKLSENDQKNENTNDSTLSDVDPF